MTGVRNKYKVAYKGEEVEVHHFGTYIANEYSRRFSIHSN